MSVFSVKRSLRDKRPQHGGNRQFRKTYPIWQVLPGVEPSRSSQSAGDSSRGQLLAAALCAASANGVRDRASRRSSWAIRIGLSRPTGGFLRPNPRCLWPLAGTAAYLAIGSLFRYQEVVSTSVRTNGSLISSLRSVVQAPSFIVLWGPLDASAPVVGTAASTRAGNACRSGPYHSPLPISSRLKNDDGCGSAR